MMAFKLAATSHEHRALLEKWPEFESVESLQGYLKDHSLDITVWSAADIGADYDRVGLSGSPTKVLKVDYVVLEAAGSQEYEASQTGMAALIEDLVQEYVL
jgi:electron transfer flavoprotein beta subunit